MLNFINGDGAKEGMVAVVDWDIDRVDGVTLVAGTVANARQTPQLVRVGTTLDGPVWEPRDATGPDPAWTEGVWEAVLEPDERRGLGFATPAEQPADERQPLEVLSTSRADERAASADALAGLEAWAPPRDVLSRDP